MNVSPKALQVINAVKNAVSSSITGVSFFSIKDYHSTTSKETANYLINVGINYKKSKEQDIEFLENIDLTAYEFNSPMELIKEAKDILIAAFIKPNENMSNGQINAFTVIFNGVEIHNETGVLYVYGYRVSKTNVRKDADNEPKKDTRKPLTKAKDELRKLLKTDKYVKFAIEVGNTLKANGDTIEL